ncbi:MAG: hypothetical protein WC659_07100 [Patescibacteria group bacterium]
MSTVKRNTTQQRFAQLAQLNELIFHAKDLANLWHISNPNNLHTTLKRYAQQGLLYRIYRGFYALKPIADLDPSMLGLKALHEYGYVSTETVLANAGIMQQASGQITLVSAQSKRFKIGDYSYRSRRLADRFLFQDIGLEKDGSLNIASAERAVADMLYFNPAIYFDGSRTIDWKKVAHIQKIIGYPFTPSRYDITSPKRSRA